MPLADKPIAVHVIGAGGTGSALLSPLAQLAVALKELGHPGIEVTVWDDDRVSKANIGRQLFALGDVGLHKAAVLVNRINAAMGLRWNCVLDRFQAGYQLSGVVIGCVDTRKARSAIHSAFNGSQNLVWIDCGNNRETGQVVFGARQNFKTVVPSVADLFPEVADVEGDAKDDQPSCSLAEALTKQDLMVNRFMADTAVNLLYQLLRKGSLDAQGAFIDVKNFRMSPIPLDDAYWASLGWKAKQPAAA